MNYATFTKFTGNNNAAKGYNAIDGVLTKVDPENFYHGSFETISSTTEELGGIIKSMKQGQFLTSGVHGKLTSGNCPKDATRSGSDFTFPIGRGLLIIDGDNLPEFGIKTDEDFILALNKIDPAMIPAEVVMSPSASSGITFNGVNSGLKGIHALLIIDNAKAIPVVLDRLHKRSVLAGLARAQITGSGTVLVKSIVDTALKTAHQPCFEGGARMLNTAITQDREVTFFAGEILISADIKALTAADEKAFTDACVKIIASVQVEADAVHAVWHAKRMVGIVAKGATLAQARQTLDCANGGTLYGNYVIETDRFGLVNVATILANPAKYHEQTCADPIDPEYGSNKAKIYSDQDKPVIHSMAHGGNGSYFLRPETDLDFCVVGEGVQHSRTEIAAMISLSKDFDDLTGRIARLVCTCDLKDSERDSLRKLIAKKAGVSLASIKADALNFEGVSSDITKLDHLQASRDVISSHGEGNLIGANGFLWLWKDRVWARIDDRETKQIIHEVASDSSLTANVVGSILDMVKTEAYLPEHRFDHNPKTINCLNGELICKDGEWLLEPHDRSHYRTAVLPVAYDPNAKAPRFEQFLAEVFKGDQDIIEKTNVICEALGYSLIPSCHLEKFVMLIGGGANGKSVLLTVLAELIGRDYTTAVQPSQFENRFQRAHLQGKLANIITEIAENATIADAQLKSLVSGEMTTAEHKHQAPFDFVPYAHHWFGTNHLPRTSDFTEALFRRALIITFNNKFDGAGRDVHLIEKLKEELPGILNMALAGLQRLNENNAFTVCSSSLEIAKQWRREADQAAQFVDEACEVGPGLKTASFLLYEKYQLWALTSGIKRTLNRNNFTSRLENLGFAKCKGTAGARLISGIALLPMFQGSYICEDFESNAVVV